MQMWIANLLFRCAVLSSFFYLHHFVDAAEDQGECFLLPECQKASVDLTVAGRIRCADGLDRQASDLIRVLENSVSISFLQTGYVDWNDVKSFSPSIQKIVATSGQRFPGKVLIKMDWLTEPSNIILQFDYWNSFGVPEKTDKQIRFAYTMFESNKAPENWVFILNNFFDGAIVPDPFLIKVYKNSGVTIPLFYIPLGRDFSAFLNAPLKTSRNSPFVFANFGTCIPRKNLVALVQAFAEAFGNMPDVRLQLGWRYADEQTRRDVYSAIASCGLTNIRIDPYGIPAHAYLQRFRNVDCYVSLSTGEGFSIQPREAIALGIPTIATNNTGQTTICSSGLVRVVPSRIEVPASYFFAGQFGVQYQCLHKDVVEALRDVYEHYDAYLRSAPQARDWVRQYQYSNMIPLYCALVKPRKVILGTENKICDDGSLVTSSEALFRKYQQLKLG